MSDFEHKIPNNFLALRSQWQDGGRLTPYSSNLGSVSALVLDESTIFVGHILDKNLILCVGPKQ